VGWDGKTPVLVVCRSIRLNGRESVCGKAALHSLTGDTRKSLRGLFHNRVGSDRAYEHYLSSIAKAVDAFRQKKNVFVIMAATERMDARACRRIRETRRSPGADLGRLQHVSNGQHSTRLPHDGVFAVSRIVTSMPALVPSAGITMDERIRNLMNERGHPELLMNVDDPDLEARTLTALELLDAWGANCRRIARTVCEI